MRAELLLEIEPEKKLYFVSLFNYIFVSVN